LNQGIAEGSPEVPPEFGVEAEESFEEASPFSTAF